MIDIHSHILPMVDDGSPSVEHSLMMLNEAYQDGSDAIVLTPHLAYPYHFDNPNDKIIALFNDFKQIVASEKIPIKLYLGCEFLYDRKATLIEHFDEITTLNDTNYLLMEFFFDTLGDEMLEAIDSVINKNLIPIIAHPERYESIQTSSNLAKQMIKAGALLQLNKGSVFGKYGNMAKEAAFDLLDHQLISFVASDSHHARYRNALMYRDFLFIQEYYGKDQARKIFNDNAKKMLQGIDIRGSRS